MKIYSKILLIALPLIVLPALLVGFVSYQLSQSAIRSVVRDVLGTRLARAVEICAENEAVLREYGLENVPANVARAQAAAATAMLEVRFGETGYVFVVDSQGIIRTHPNTNLMGRDVSAAGWFQEIVSVGSGDTRYVWQGESRWAAFGYFEAWDWYVISSGAESELAGAINRLGVYTLVLLAVSLVIATATLLLLARWLTAPIHALIAGTEKITQGELETHIPVTSRDEVGVLAGAFNSMTAQLRDLIGSLEQRVAERTADLGRRSSQLEAAARVARDAAAIRDVRQLLDATVRLISDRFGFYHAGIFLVDEATEYAVLRAASSEGGQRMLERQHKLKVGEVGIVGYATGTGAPRVALDVGEDAVFFSNPDLPDTRSEMALPLKVRDRVIGALDVQSTEAAAFLAEDVAVLQTLADQVALAIENARLLEEAQRALAEVQRAQRFYIREEWGSYVREHEETVGYLAESEGVRVANDWVTPEMRQALAEQQLVALSSGEDGERAALAVPLELRGETIGVLDLAHEGAERVWTEEDRVIVESFSEQLALALENARLFDQTQGALSLSERLYEASRKIMEAQEATQIYQTVIEEYVWYGVADHVILALAGPKPVFEPEYLDVVMVWNRDEETATAAVGTRYHTGDLPLITTLPSPTEPSVITDLATDPRLDDTARQAMIQGWGTHSMVSIPLASGGDWFGLFVVQTHDARVFTDEEIRFYRSLADRAAMAMQARQLLQVTVHRAQREQLAREITTKIRGSADVDVIIQVALQELRQALGVTHAAIRLGSADMLGTPDSSRTSSSDIVADAQNLADGKVLA